MYICIFTNIRQENVNHALMGTFNFMTVRSRYVQTGTNLSRVTITVYCNYTAGQIYRWYMAIPMQFL